MFKVFLVVFRESQLMQRAANYRLGLIALGHHDRLKPFSSLRHVHVATNEVVEVSSLHQRHRHISVVVVVLGDMTIGAAFGLGCPDCMREMRTESNSAVSFSRYRLLLRIYPFAIGVLRAYKNRAC